MALIQDMYSKRDTYLVNSSPYSIIDNGTYLVDASSGAVFVNLPDISLIDGMFICIKKIDGTSNSMVVTPSGAQTIDEATNAVYSHKFDTVSIVSQGGNWYASQTYTPATTPSGQKVIMIAQFSQGQGTGYSPFVEITASYPTFATAGSLWFGGSGIMGVPGQVVAVVGRSGTKAATSSYVQVYDITNSLEICSFNFTNNLQHLEKTISLSNVSIGEAIWDIRMSDAGSNPPSCQLYSISIL